MLYRGITRRSKRQQITLIARLIAVLTVAVMLILSEFIYILLARPGEIKVFADDTDQTLSGDVIVIPVADNSEDKDSVSEDEKEEPAKPVVKINITEPDGWHRKSAKVKISAEDIGDSGDFIIAEVKAKIGNGGGWTVVTDSMSIELSEDGVVYVEVTDTKGRTYSRNKKISCFDSTKPTLNAAVNNGNLTVETNDNDSGVKAVYVNGFEFTNLNEGTLNIRMQQFDTGYEYFAIQAMDYAGNMSDTYRVNNPYYKRKDASGKEAKILPDSVQPTKPAEAVASVTEHMKTDDAGNALANAFGSILSSNSIQSQADEKKKSLAEADKEEIQEKPETIPGKGREFYTIEAKSGKVFYLIIDRTGDEEEVRFVTDITENDLLNVTGDISNTIPQNAAAPYNGDLITESALPNNNLQIDDIGFNKEVNPDITVTEEATEGTEPTEAISEDEIPWEEKKESPVAKFVFVVFAILFLAAGITVVVLIRNNKDGNYSEEEDDNSNFQEDEDQPKKNVEDAFFDVPPEENTEQIQQPLPQNNEAVKQEQS